MENFYPIWSSGRTDTMQPQIYNWAQADRQEQSANIGRQTAYDAQAIQNANNYYQMQQANEARDYERMRNAGDVGYQRQTVQDEIARRERQRQEELKSSRDYLRLQDEWNQRNNETRLNIADQNSQSQAQVQAAKMQQANQADAAKIVNYFETGGKDLPDQTGSLLFQVPANLFAQVAAPYRATSEKRQMDQVQMDTADMLAKEKQDAIRWDAIERSMKLRLPENLRDRMVLDHASGQWKQPGTPGYAPWAGFNPPPNIPGTVTATSQPSSPVAPPATQTQRAASAPAPQASYFPPPQQSQVDSEMNAIENPSAQNPVITPAPQPVKVVKPAGVVTIDDVNSAKQNAENIRKSMEVRMTQNGDPLPKKSETKLLDEALKKHEELLNKYISDGMVEVITPEGKHAFVHRKKVPAMLKLPGYSVVK